MSALLQASVATTSTSWARATVLAAKGALLLVLPALLLRESAAQSTAEGFNAGPDLIVGEIPTLQQFGSSGTQVGLAIGSASCNNGDVELDFFAMPNTNH